MHEVCRLVILPVSSAVLGGPRASKVAERRGRLCPGLGLEVSLKAALETGATRPSVIDADEVTSVCVPQQGVTDVRSEVSASCRAGTEGYEAKPCELSRRRPETWLCAASLRASAELSS